MNDEGSSFSAYKSKGGIFIALWDLPTAASRPVPGSHAGHTCMREEATNGKSQRPSSRGAPRSLPRTGDTAELQRQCHESLCVEAPGMAHAIRHCPARRSPRDHQEGMEPNRRRGTVPQTAARKHLAIKEEEMSINGPPYCPLCNQPIAKGIEVLLGKRLFHPGCAVVVAKERKHEHTTDDARRSEEGHERGIVSCADSGSN